MDSNVFHSVFARHGHFTCQLFDQVIKQLQTNAVASGTAAAAAADNGGCFRQASLRLVHYAQEYASSTPTSHEHA